jgi:hypothetical protein
VPFTDYDHMVERIVPKTSNPLFGNSVLPRAAEAGVLPEIPTESRNRCTPLNFASRSKITYWSSLFSGMLAELLYDPFAGRMLGHIEMEDLWAAMPSQKQTVQNPEVCRDHGEEIHPDITSP